MIAIKRLQSIMWILLVAMGALAAYLISLQVATERNAVRHTIDQIRWTRSDIRYLEAEFGARATMRQLHAWNTSDLRLYVPGPAQYLPNERALANLDRMAPVSGGYSPPPVMTAMAESSAVPAQAEAAEKPAQSRAESVASEFAFIRTASAAEPKPVIGQPRRNGVVARASEASGEASPRKTVEPDPAARKNARLALLDEKLLGGPALSEARVP
ncbi:MAG: colicin transporter [Alphaproteobacteria bacterium]|nr:colicin transporter [Alphaproteobacteria bacterium]MBU0793986.1 colicin transporter [Alphaproteobacteria bacterium]MBU0874534.1 colicin transporter [Alphaproteobacteria bacterium]MBU1769847.1 colicin transporter [Alphaproteobacteria bacterium]